MSVALSASRAPEATATAGRRLLLGGPAYTVLLVLAAAAFPSAPGGDVAGAADPAWLVDHVGSSIAQSYVRALAGLALVVLAVGVGTLARRAHPGSAMGGLAVVGGALCGGLIAAAQAVALAAARFVDGGGAEETTRALGHLQEALLDASSLPAALLFAATGVVALSLRGVPQWFGWLSLAGVPLAVVDTLSYDGGPLAAFGLVGLVYFLAWSLLSGVLLGRARG